MHYCIHLLTETLPSKEDIEEIMRPFNDDEAAKYDDEGELIEPITAPFMWDYWVVGGRYAGRLKLKVDYEAEDEYRWKFYEHDKPRTGRLFHSTLLEEIRKNFPIYKKSEEDWFSYLGDGTFIRVDGAKIAHLLNDLADLGCYGFVDADGTGYSRERWTGHEWLENPDFDSRYQEALKNNADGFITVLDIHD